MAKKYGVASDYIKYTSRIKSDTSDGVAVEASQVVDLEEDKLQSDINKELKASIASASGNTYSKSEIDSKDTATLTSAKSYADTKKTEAVSAAATDAATKANAALASAKSYADQKVSALGSVYTTKGSCTAAQLKALTSAKAGDVWNITDAISIDGKAYPAGVNVVCVTAFSAAIDPATTKNWDALQGLQDLTSYAKKSEIEDTAVANVKFAQEEVGQENGVSFKKTITFVNGREATTESDLGILPATSTTAGVMSAADKVKLDAVDGKIGDVEVGINSGSFYIVNPKHLATFGTSTIGVRTNIGNDVNIFDSVSIGESAHIEDNVNIGTSVEIKKNVSIGEGVSIGIGEGLDGGVVTIEKGFDSFGGVSLGTLVGTNLQELNNQIGAKVAIGTGVHIASNIGLAMTDNYTLMWGCDGGGQYYTRIAATTDDISGLTSQISALATRVSALEDLLKLA
jgi:acetyltransferase-like isoleucine patch superfamily enzyme